LCLEDKDIGMEDLGVSDGRSDNFL